MPEQNTPTTPAPITETPAAPPPDQAKKTVDPNSMAADPFMRRNMVALGILDPDPSLDPVSIVDPTAVNDNPTFGEIATMAAERKKDKEDAAAKAIAPATPAPATPATPAPATPETPKPVKVGKPIEKIVEDIVERRLPRQPDPVLQPAPATPAPVVTTDPFESQLTDAEREELDLVRYAAAKDDKLKGLPDQFIRYYKAAQEFLEKKEKDDPDFDPFAKDVVDHLAKLRPNFTTVDIKRFERQRIKEEAVAEARREQSGEIAQLREDQRRIEMTPKVERAVKDFSTQIHDSIVSSASEGQPSVAAEIALEAKTKGWKAVEEQDSVLAPLVRQAFDDAVVLADTYLKITSGVERIDVQDPRHASVVKFIDFQGKNFAANGGDSVKRRFDDGVTRTFLPLSEMGRLKKANPDQAKKHWTYDEQDVLELINKYAVVDANHRVKSMYDQLQKSGYTRPKTPAASATPAQSRNGHVTETPVSSPRSVTPTTPGPAAEAPKSKGNGIYSDSEFASQFPGVKV